jgi:hypothetical protein
MQRGILGFMKLATAENPDTHNLYLIDRYI